MTEHDIMIQELHRRTVKGSKPTLAISSHITTLYLLLSTWKQQYHWLNVD